MSNQHGGNTSQWEKICGNNKMQNSTEWFFKTKALQKKIVIDETDLSFLYRPYPAES